MNEKSPYGNRQMNAWDGYWERLVYNDPLTPTVYIGPILAILSDTVTGDRIIPECSLSLPQYHCTLAYGC